MREAMRFVARRIPGVLLTLGAVLGLACIILAVAAPILHVRPLIFLSGSMSPTIPAGSLALARETPGSQLRVGDVVTVPLNDTYLTHRVVQVAHHDGGASLLLQGDANRKADPTVYEVESAPRTFVFVPHAGTVIAWLSRPPGVFVLAGYAMFVVSSLRRARGRRGGGADAPPEVTTGTDDLEPVAPERTSLSA
jgi:signal peptidase I